MVVILPLWWLRVLFLCQNWAVVKKILAKAGSESIEQRTVAIDVSTVPVEAAEAAQSWMKDITPERIKNNSFAAFHFYQWVS